MTLLAQFAATGGALPAYIEDVFSTYLYTGNGSTQTITNGIDLAGKGGLVWCKDRALADTFHEWFDTARGAYMIGSNTTAAQTARSFSFGSTGFTIGSNNDSNINGDAQVSWTFRKQPKFFDVVTWTGDASGNRTLSHTLASTPGCIIIKATNAVDDWYVYHTSLGTNKWLYLNTTSAEQSGSIVTAVSSTTFTVSQSNGFNTNGRTYVAYLFAHDAGGFGLTGTDNVISCGSYVGNSTSGVLVNLGWEPQWILFKNVTTGGTNSGWYIHDSMRGLPAPPSLSITRLQANTSGSEVVEASSSGVPQITATGFNLSPNASTGYNNTGDTYIYIAIRRGPMKTPTSGTSVFAPVANTQSSGTVRTIGFPADLAISTGRTTNLQRMFNDRLRGFSQTNTSNGPRLFSNTTDAETTSFTGVGAVTNTGYQDGDYFDPGISMIRYLFGRAPGFFDEVCYTGTGSARTVTHNLGVAPELMVVKRRSTTGSWPVYSAALGNTGIMFLDLTSANAGPDSQWSSTTPTSTVFTVGSSNEVNGSGSTYVAYLFASCPGVSKVGSYTGTGTTLQVDCGFTGGARFVLIKRTDSTGDWYVWDSARGIVAGNDPYLLLNSTAAEVTSTDYVDTYNGGFEISNTAPAAINASGGSFIYLAIA